MNEIYPIAKLKNLALLINKDDLPFVGKKTALEVKCIKVDLRNKTIDPIFELELHLKFNPWEEVPPQEKDMIIQEVYSSFSDQEINDKITKPLTQNKIII